MEEVDGFRITRGATLVQEGYLPVIEALGRTDGGRVAKGYVTVTQYGTYDEKDDAISVARNVKIRSVVVDGGGVSIRIDGY
ncbi:hypothetical protein [Achromobacter insolitus]|uniref:hypothetical protein n=1 Tax=Achromobacter insolitus TaxID=217204 RepID=UPI00241CA268|nr:hypothetical protein [Achromobacter insolitus]